MAEIHPTAVISEDAQLGKGVIVGPYSVIDGDVVIGDRTEIGQNVRIFQFTEIGNESVSTVNKQSVIVLRCYK